MISLVAGALAYAGPAHRCAPPSPRRAVLRDHAQIVAALGRQAPEQSAQREALARLGRGASTEDLLLPFGELCDVVGFTEYNAEAARYATET